MNSRKVTRVLLALASVVIGSGAVMTVVPEESAITAASWEADYELLTHEFDPYQEDPTADMGKSLEPEETFALLQRLGQTLPRDPQHEAQRKTVAELLGLLEIDESSCQFERFLEFAQLTHFEANRENVRQFVEQQQEKLVEFCRSLLDRKNSEAFAKLSESDKRDLELLMGQVASARSLQRFEREDPDVDIPRRQLASIALSFIEAKLGGNQRLKEELEAAGKAKKESTFKGLLVSSLVNVCQRTQETLAQVLQLYRSFSWAVTMSGVEKLWAKRARVCQQIAIDRRTINDLAYRQL